MTAMNTGDLSKWFFVGVWQWILVLIPSVVFYLFGGGLVRGLDENPALRLLIYLVLLFVGFVISGWGAVGAVGRVK